MKTFKLVFIVVLTLSLIVVVVQNTAPVYASFLWLKVQMPIFLLLFFTLAGGFVLGIMVKIFVDKTNNGKSNKGGKNE